MTHWLRKSICDSPLITSILQKIYFITVLHVPTLSFALLKNQIFGKFAFKMRSHFKVKKAIIFFEIEGMYIKRTKR